MQGQRGFWDFKDRLKELSAEGDPHEKLSETVDFELFRPVLVKALRRSTPRRAVGQGSIRSSSSGCWCCRPCTGCLWRKRATWCRTA